MDYVQEHLSESKRKSRNLSEKKRRDAFNTLVTELAVLVTGVERRLDKSNVLKQTIAFLKKHNQLQAECASTEEIDHSRPSFLSADEYFRLLLDSMNAFLFVVDVGTDGDAASICYVSENAAVRFGSTTIADHLRGKSLYDFLDQENLAIVREIFRSKVNEFATVRSGDKAEMANSAAFLRFHCSFGIIGDNWAKDQDRTGMEYSITARFKTLDVSSTLVCVCLAKPCGLKDLNTIAAISVPSAKTASLEFSTRMDVEWRFIHVDQNVTRILGYQPIEMLGMSCYDYCHPDDLDKLAESHEKLKTQTDGVTAPYRFRTKGERYVWIRTRFYVTYCEWNSKPEFIVATSVVVGNGDHETGGDVNANGKSLATVPASWRVSADLDRSDQLPLNQSRKILRPQPGVSIEHTPISKTTPISKPPPAKKLKNLDDGDETAKALGQLNERMLWELLEKRQTNLQEKIFQHQQELKRLQEQLFNAVPLLSSSSPASSNGTNETELTSPASSGLSPAGAALNSGCTTRPNSNAWSQQTPEQIYGNHAWTLKCFENGGGHNSYPM